MIKGFNILKADFQKSQRRDSLFMVGYLDSMEDNWRDILDELCCAYNIACFVSPLHDSDGGKSHYHFLFIAHKQVYMSSYTKIAKCTGIVQATYTEDKLKSYEYLWHKNNPEKAQYNQDDIIRLGSCEDITYESLQKTKPYDCFLSNIIKFIISNQVTELVDLYSFEAFAFLGDIDNIDTYYQLLSKHHIVIRDLVSSIRNSKKSII